VRRRQRATFILIVSPGLLPPVVKILLLTLTLLLLLLPQLLIATLILIRTFRYASSAERHWHFDRFPRGTSSRRPPVPRTATPKSAAAVRQPTRSRHAPEQKYI